MSNKYHLSSRPCKLPEGSNKQFFFAEVVESTLQSCVAQAWEWDRFPAFGAPVIVLAEPYAIIGAVSSIKTGSLDPARYPIAYKKTMPELAREQPQIFQFLQTMLSIKVLGYAEMDSNHVVTKIWYTLPPEPARIHHFVGPACEELIALFFQQPEYLHLLCRKGDALDYGDELLIAVMRMLKSYNILSEIMIQGILAQLTMIIGNDYRFIKRFIGRITPFLEP